ncbi:hypothetical protein ATO7_14188 [Oceanococcus atlanticus]|uniref:EF-hand domain-containing protein n=1 Tax=Oceanococcus atlanticus TaxID=1317117 RepID=A0A1Y1SD11_9GAMM|nr:hypothetical protein [Oceanococcus atlanticus]ORE86453.1 hypothetical protein ATO7_14188 [Oceanococcus atlanticus]
MNSKLVAAIFANLVLSSGAAMARGPHMDAMDLNADGAISEAEVMQLVANKAQAIDSNGDGLISLDELEAMQERRKARHIQHRLERADSNADGNVDVDEFSAQMAARIMQRDRDGDGQLSAEELAPPRGGRKPDAAPIDESF